MVLIRAGIWELLEEFFRSRALFRKIHEVYEESVLQHADEKGVDRAELRLDADAVSALLDTRQLGDLRDRHLFRLKELSHGLFRTADSTDVFDRYVTDAFHEISILKEEHLKVFTFAPDYDQLEEQEEYQAILDEVHHLFPIKVHHVYTLFEKAKNRLEQLIPSYSRDTVLMRSLFLFGDDLLGEVYEGGLHEFYRILYPELGATEAFYRVGKSFLGAGFLDHARDAFEKCIDAGRKESTRTPLLEKIVAEAGNHLERAKLGSGTN
jgi:hypothetical protein